MRKLQAVKITLLILPVIVSLVLAPGIDRPGPAGRPLSVPTYDPLGKFEGVGATGNLSWTGDGQRLSNPSFETGLSPWTQSSSNTANGSAITLVDQGYQTNNSARLSVNSGNSSALSLASDSTEGLRYDLAQENIAFNAATRFRAAVQIQAITGNSGTDEVEISLTLTTSTGNVRIVHYVFGDGSSLPANTGTDGYVKVPGFGATGQWMVIDRNLMGDATGLFSGASSIDSIQSITLTVHAQSIPGAPTIDPHIKYWEAGPFGHWAYGEPVLYDANNNGAYDSGETIIGCGYPNSCTTFTIPNGTSLSTDPRIKFVDFNHDGKWSCSAIATSVCMSGEPVVYDNDLGTSSGDGIYDYGEPLINCASSVPNCVPTSPPLPGTLLVKVVQGHTQALFDQIELYTAAGGYDWVKNGGFEAGTNSWFTTGVSSIASPVHSGLKSVRASVTGGTAELDQSIDARPQLDSSMTFRASINLQTMTGTSASDSVDLWLGLDDSLGHSLALYYYFKTGTGTIPANRTDTVYLKANGFGSFLQWLNINENLLQRVQSAVQSNGLSYVAPYTLELVVLEASASTSQTTNAVFDDISLATPYHSSSHASHFYSSDGTNTTFVYTASIQQGAFSLAFPLGQTLLNITAPEGTALQPGEFATSTSALTRTITVPDSTSFKHAPVGDWKFFTTSTNGIAIVYAEDPTSHAQLSSARYNSTANLVSQSRDPFGQPLQNNPANLTLWNSNSVKVANWSGLTNSQGWFNVSSTTLPPPGMPPGMYKLQATVSSIMFPGVRTFQIAIGVSTPTITIAPTNGPPGTQAEVQGSGFPQSIIDNSTTVQLTFDAVLVGFATAHSGNFTFTFIVPQALAGQHFIRALDSTNGASASTTFQVTARPLHDVALLVVQPQPRRVVSGQLVSIYATVSNFGNSSETVDLTTYYDSKVAGSLASAVLFPTSETTLLVLWNTTGVSPGNYTISATVFLANDQNLSNNNLSDGPVTVLPPPTIITTPTSGPVGTQVQVQGAGFPIPPYGPFSQIIVSFDDQFIGFTTASNGQFSFTFNIPLAQPGSHNIKAYDASTGLLASNTFQVTIVQPQTALEVTATVGAIYFPGETAVITVQANLNGQIASGTSFRIIVVRPDGSNVTLNTTPVSAGQWKANYLIPTRGSFGTYEVIVKAHQTGSLDGTTIASFEVKPTWLQAHSSLVTGTIAALGTLSTLGVLVVSWRGGYLARRGKNELARD